MSSNIWFFDEFSEIGFLYRNFLSDHYNLLQVAFNLNRNRYEIVGDVPPGKKTLVIKFSTNESKFIYNGGSWIDICSNKHKRFSLSETYFNTVSYFQELGFNIIFDRVMESVFMHPKLVPYLLNKLEAHNINLSKVAFATNNYYSNNVFFENYNNTRLKFVEIPFFLLFSHIIASKYDSTQFKLKEILNSEKRYPFIIPIRKGKPERLLLLSMLFNLNLLEKSKWSLAPTFIPKNTNFSRIKEFADTYNIQSAELLPKFIDKNDKKYDLFKEDDFLKYHDTGGENDGFNLIDDIHSISWSVKFSDINKWVDSKVHICCETFTSDTYNSLVRPSTQYCDILHLTEKIFKPIRTATPFVVLGQQRSLKALKSYGFETFDSIIDESYDEIKLDFKKLRVRPAILDSNVTLTDTEKILLSKIRNVVNAGSKLLTQSNSSKVREITTHNFNHMKNSNFFKDFFVKNVVEKLNSLF